MDSSNEKNALGDRRVSQTPLLGLQDEENDVTRMCSACLKHDEKATFFCQEHGIFLCHDCFHGVSTTESDPITPQNDGPILNSILPARSHVPENASHAGHFGADSIKSLLSKQLVLWRDLSQ